MKWVIITPVYRGAIIIHAKTMKEALGKYEEEWSNDSFESVQIYAVSGEG